MAEQICSDIYMSGWFSGPLGVPFFRQKLLPRQSLAQACIHILACESLGIEW